MVLYILAKIEKISKFRKHLHTNIYIMLVVSKVASVYIPIVLTFVKIF